MKKVLENYINIDIENEIKDIKNRHTMQTQHIKNKLR